MTQYYYSPGLIMSGGVNEDDHKVLEVINGLWDAKILPNNMAQCVRFPEIVFPYIKFTKEHCTVIGKCRANDYNEMLQIAEKFYKEGDYPHMEERS